MDEGMNWMNCVSIKTLLRPRFWVWVGLVRDAIQWVTSGKMIIMIVTIIS
jgi:hypothetical protein